MKLRWTESAQSDLLGIQSYIARDSSAYADAVIDRIIIRALGIVDFPESGQVVPEYDRDDIREVYVYSFRLIYSITSDEIRMLTVIHGSRLLPDLPPDAA